MLKSAIMATTLALAAAPYMAGANRPQWNPPARYDHPFKGAMDITRLPQQQVVTACKKLLEPLGIPVHSNQHGCSFVIGDQCHIVTVDHTFEGASPQAVIRHETGHCNGWPSDHPQ